MGLVRVGDANNANYLRIESVSIFVEVPGALVEKSACLRTGGRVSLSAMPSHGDLDPNEWARGFATDTGQGQNIMRLSDVLLAYFLPPTMLGDVLLLATSLDPNIPRCILVGPERARVAGLLQIVP